MFSVRITAAPHFTFSHTLKKVINVLTIIALSKIYLVSASDHIPPPKAALSMAIADNFTSQLVNSLLPIPRCLKMNFARSKAALTPQHPSCLSLFAFRHRGSFSSAPSLLSYKFTFCFMRESISTNRAAEDMPIILFPLSSTLPAVRQIRYAL